jgi:DNA-binding NtrC family response regulator
MIMGVHLVGVSRALREIEQEIDYVAPLDVKVLITGESGVGKSVVARLIHQRSQRTGPFVTINCAARRDVLLESELFGGHGRVTGAYQDMRGWLERAQGGTIFLDDVAEMSPRIQARLLQFFESGESQRVGSDRVRTVRDVRVITATNRHLLECVLAGAFREDLYYRMNVIHMVVPPLRERPEDVAPLIAHFLETFSAAHHLARPLLAEPAMAKLTAYAWPGNVSELATVTKRLVVSQGVGAISTADLPMGIAHRLIGPGSRAPRTRTRRSMAHALSTRVVEGGASLRAVLAEQGAAHARRRRYH